MMSRLKSSLENNSKATDHMKSLHEDVIILILAMLPVKILMRFRCVCKSWYDLIRSPNFIEMHSLYTKHQKNECILIQRFNNDHETVLSFLSYESLNVISPNLKITPPNFDSAFSRFNISWPCNGLLLCVSTTLILCNPATREFKLLPPHPHPFSNQDPDRVLVYKFGLGFDLNKDEYKVFLELYHEDDDCYESLVYNLSTNSWRQTNSPETDDRFIGAVQGIPYNGALHWVVEGDESDYDIIICFDLSSEEFQDIELPQAINSLDYQIDKNLTIVNDCLALFTFIDYSSDLESRYVDIWVMKKYGEVESWIKQFSVSGIENTFSYWYPHFLWKNEAILIETETENREEKSKLLSCALDTHIMTDTRLLNDYELHGVMLYKESLVSIT